MILKDDTPYLVFNNRWKEEPCIVLRSFYTYSITSFDDFVDITFDEVVPDNNVIPWNKLAVKTVR